eukprot:scaffold4026_cov117-Cylindrotheca_fusiformis.AAC.34
MNRSSAMESSTSTFDDEEGDTITPMCTCGDRHDDFQSLRSSRPNSKRTPSWLESSFVHLSAPRETYPLSISRHVHPQHGYLEQHSHIMQLVEATDPSSQVSLCTDCIERIATALEENTQRLYAECHAYQEAVIDSKQRAKTFDAVSKVGLETTTKSYQSEIDMLAQEVEAREAELEHLNSLYKDQLEITKQLDAFEEQFQVEQNALELKAKSFDDYLQQLSNQLSQAQSEVDRLSVVQLPQAIFDLQVDERGLRYPLINQLRLAFLPKGDVPVKEIQVAWSQATQLLLIVGTLLKYTSSDWKLVPLADCAKLIYRKEIYNMSPGDCRSLIAWNALLDQVLVHACSQHYLKETRTTKMQPPFTSSPTTIGNIELTTLDKTDHVGWSQVIHRMASNLLWLSKICSEQVAAQVMILAHSIA